MSKLFQVSCSAHKFSFILWGTFGLLKKHELLVVENDE
jgi:hypothetical protein